MEKTEVASSIKIRLAVENAAIYLEQYKKQLV